MAKTWQRLAQIFALILVFNGLVLLVYAVLYSSNPISFINLIGKNSTSVHPFVGFDNITGVDHFIVPNIIHFIRFNQTEYSFVDYLCLMAAFRNHRPDYFYIHSNVEDKFHGKYWGWIQKDVELMQRIRLFHLDLPMNIFGQKLSEGWRLQHGSDVSRIRIMMKYGGIYLDNDVFVIRNLDKYRKFEISMNWDEDQFIGNQVFIAHKDARFLKLYLESYRNNYHSDRWYYNGGERPTVEILYRQPELLHRVKGNFGADTSVSMRLYKDHNFNWRKLDVIHLLMNHRSYMDPGYKKLPVFNEENIKSYKSPFGEMARDIMNYD